MESPVQKKIRSEKSGASESIGGATQSDENVLNSSIYLTYDVLRIIFQHLDAKDLASAARVCRSWLEAANNEKGTRGPCCFIQVYKSHEFLSHIKSIRVKPSAGFFFIPETTPRNIEDHIWALLPEHCELIMLYSKGLIMDKEMEYHPFPNMVCAFLPQIPNVRIKSYEIASPGITKPATYGEIISSIDRDASKSNHKKSTCLMLFCNYAAHTTARRWTRMIQKSKENEVVSVWGGVLEDMYAIRFRSNSVPGKILGRMDGPYCVAVLITGSIQTWSIILKKECNTKERVEARLKLFKEKVKLKKHSVGFMFACTARGSNLYNEANIESATFKSFFPKVPLVGCFGYGEFGKSTIGANEEINCKEKHNCKRSKSWYNEFSTVFLILTYG